VKLDGEGQPSNLVRSEEFSQSPGSDAMLVNDRSRRSGL